MDEKRSCIGCVFYRFNPVRIANRCKKLGRDILTTEAKKCLWFKLYLGEEVKND